MKRLLQSFKRQDGFTLVELMVVVAIIGLLSAVAIPNFKKYQAKAKVSEAKLQLSGLYMAMTSFYSDFSTYAQCLRYMGYDPETERTNRYYAVGWAGATAVPAAAYTSAANAGLNTDATLGCPASAAYTNGLNYSAGKGAGNAIALPSQIVWAGDTNVGALGMNSTTFTAGAVGIIDGAKTAAAANGSSVLVINHTKRLYQVPGREGY